MTQMLEPTLKPRLNARKFTVEEFEKLYFAGVLSTDARVELLDGQVIELSPQSDLHKYAISNYTEIILERYARRVVVMPQVPLDVNLPHYQPEPDIAILHPPKTQYKIRKNHASDVLWLIEVSDSTLEKDREIKLPIYATAGVPEVWIHNVGANQLEVYTRPNASEARYARLETFSEGETVTPVCFPGEPLEWW
jgi:Uma2 family endonuclease